MKFEQIFIQPNKLTDRVKFIFTKVFIVFFQTLFYTETTMFSKTRVTLELDRKSKSILFAAKCHHTRVLDNPSSTERAKLLDDKRAASPSCCPSVLWRHEVSSGRGSFYGNETREICVRKISFYPGPKGVDEYFTILAKIVWRSTDRVYTVVASMPITAKRSKGIGTRRRVLKPSWRNNFPVFCGNRICVIY